MNHEAASGKLLELAYGELSPGEARAVEAHVAGCEACRAELAGIRDTRALMALLPVEPPPSRGEGIVLAAAREAAEARRPRPLLPRWLWAGTAGAMAAAVIAVVSWQLVKTAPGGPTAEREGDLLGRSPPAVAASPAPPQQQPATQYGKARSEEAPSPPAPAVAKRAPESPRAKGGPLPGLQREQVCERMGEAGAAAGPAGAASGKGDGWIALGAGQEKEERSAAPAPAEKPSTAWRQVPPQAEPAADAVAPAAAMAAPAPAPPPAPAGGAAPARAKAAATAERKAAAPTALRDEAEAAPEARAPARATRDFPGCPGERQRWVFTDGEGRVVRYARVLADGRRIEQSYGPDGRLIGAGIAEGKVMRLLPLDTPWLVRDARDAGLDAPPRCGQVPAVP